MPRTQMRLAVLALLIQLGMATNYTVGGGSSGGWDTSSNPEGWASAQRFVVGDNLIFQFTFLHNVLEVSKADYDSCSTSNPTQTYSISPAVVALSSRGKRYFICGTTGHCGQGMKIEADTLASSSSPPSTSPAPSASPAPSSPAPSTPSPAAPAAPPISPVTPPSPPPSPQTSPQTSPSPKSSPPPSSPASSPATTSPDGPSVGSPTSSPPPSPSSAYRGSVQAILIVGFSSIMTFLLAL